MARDPVDLVVVGSGAGGAPVALALARAGARVVLLEKGRELQPEELVHDEIRFCRRDLFVPYAKDDPHIVVRPVASGGPAPRPERTNEAWTSRVVGGGTVHMSGYFFRMKPVDLRLRSALGPVDGAEHSDWPISYEQLEPWYARAERELGVSGRWKVHPFEEPRSSDYLLPPLEEHPFGQRIDAACAGLGLHPFPTPRGILSKESRGRQACGSCALCASYPCESGAKSSTTAALLPEARATGRCELRPGCQAAEVLVDARGRASGVVYLGPGGVREVQPARCVVLACSAVESARLLLLSRSALFPQGLANGSGQVGRHLLFSGLSRAHGLFRHRGRADRAWMTGAAPFVQRSLQDAYWRDEPRDGVRKGGTVVFSFAHPNPIFTAERVARSGGPALWGRALKERLRDEARGSRALEIETFAEFLPTPATRVELDPSAVDRAGLPAARITIGRHPLDLAASGALHEQGLSVLRALGADALRTTVQGGEMTVLQGGTCRFGTDPATTVLDPDCRAHEVPNLYVTDGSFLPTSGGAPFTLTILANAFRVADRIASRFRAGKL
jgi:choline dehydrogenase-like flavoprotein